MKEKHLFFYLGAITISVKNSVTKCTIKCKINYKRILTSAFICLLASVAPAPVLYFYFNCIGHVMAITCKIMLEINYSTKEFKY